MPSNLGSRLIFLVALALPTIPMLPAEGQQSTVTTLAQAQIPVVPRHHHHIYFTFNIDGCNPTQGYYILFQLNSTGTDCPETLCIAPWLKCGSGGVATGPAGVA